MFQGAQLLGDRANSARKQERSENVLTADLKNIIIAGSYLNWEQVDAR